MREKEERDPIDWGYVRASTEKQKSTLISQHEALIAAGCNPDHIIVDDDTTGKTNMTDEGTGWAELQGKLMKGDRLIVHSHTRLGRKNHEIIYAVGNPIERGISVWDLKSNQIYDDLDDFEQVLKLNMNSAFGDKERVEISSRTKTGLKTRSDAGFKIGQKKKLPEPHRLHPHSPRGGSRTEVHRGRCEGLQQEARQGDAHQPDHRCEGAQRRVWHDCREVAGHQRQGARRDVQDRRRTAPGQPAQERKEG